MAKPNNPDQERLRPLPKPIKLDLPNERPKPQRRLHDPDDHNQNYDYTHIPESEKPTKRDEEPGPERPLSGGYYKSAQKAYGQRRPRQPKPPKQKPPKRQTSSQSPRLGKGDRLYTPPMQKKPLIPKQVKRIMKFWALGIIGIAFIVLVVMSMFRSNAWAVYLDDRFIGYMPINREIETYTVHDDAVRHLSATYGAAVQVNGETIVREARARRGELMAPPDMMILLSQSFSYQLVAAAIYIDNERVALLRNEYEVEHVASELKRQYIQEENNIYSNFEEDWQLRDTLVDSVDDLDTASEVIQLLERPVSDVFEHTIRSGDTQGALAIEFNTSLERIGYLNNITVDTILRVGETILLETTRPRLTVITIDEITRIENIQMDIDVRENDDLHVSVTRVITEGSYGQQEVRQRITSRNGIPVGAPEIVSTPRVLREPITRVVEVGTSETAILVR